MRRALTVVARSVAVAGLLALLGFAARPAQAQYDLGPLSVRGGVSFSAEAYTVDGLSRRRAPAMLTAQANTGFEVFGLRSGLNLTYSTDQNQLRQSINRLAFETRWDWGRVEAGDVTPSMGAYSLNGTVLRGGAVELRPRDFVLSLAAGRSQRAIGPTADEAFREPSFQQFTYAAKLGYGYERSTHVHLTGVYVRDVASSLSQDDLTVESQLGTTEALAPQENVSLSPDLGLELWNGALTLRTQLTASALTRNLRGPEDDSGDLPFFMAPLITDRRGTRVDYAGEGTLEAEVEPVGVRLAYERVQPGFESLSVPQVRSDHERISAEPRVDLLGGRLRVGTRALLSRNNLQGQRQATYRRLQLGVNTQAQVTDRVSVGGSYTLMRNENDPSDTVDDPLQVQQLLLLHTATLSPSYTLQQDGGLSHVVTLSGSLQRTADQSDAIDAGLRPAFSTTNVSTTASYGVTFASGTDLGLSGNYVWSEASNTNTQVRGVTVRAGHGFFDRKLRLSTSAGWSQNEVTTVQAAQASVALLAPKFDADLQSLQASDASFQTSGWYDRVAARLPSRGDYAWYLSELMHGTGSRDVYSSEVAYALDRGYYDAKMLDELATTFESLSTQWTAQVGASYQLPTGNVIRLDVRTLLSRADAGSDFQEVQATLRYSHRF